jgi:diguanylate cyclase (GGDEF)-like protein
METKLYLRMLQKGWWVILLTALAALVISLIVTYFAVPVYRSTARFIIVPNSSLTSGQAVLDSLGVLDRVTVVTTYAEIMNSERINADTLALLKLQPKDLVHYSYQAVVLPNTSILELSATGPNPQTVATLANSVGYQTIAYTKEMKQVFDINFLDTATPSTIPISPQPLQDVSVAFVLGLVGGAALVILREQLRIPMESYRQRLRLDNVTGVYNNRYFPRLVDEKLANDPGDLLTLGFIELNGLRDLLGTLPMASLNSILIKVTASLQKELRGNDMIGRWNEVTFVVMLPNTSGMAANRIFERIQQVLSVPTELGQLGSAVLLDPHIGGAEYSNNISTQDLFEKADTALSQARRDNSKPVYIWTLKNPFWAKKATEKSVS